MSFSITTPQMRSREKDVTRRLGWWTLQPGTRLRAVEKGMGLRKGEKVVVIGEIEIVSVNHEPLARLIEDDRYGLEECRREGFPQLHPMGFVTMFCASHSKCLPSSIVNRIEFKHL